MGHRDLCVCVVCAGFSCLGRGRGVCVHIVLNVYVWVSALHMNVCVCVKKIIVCGKTGFVVEGKSVLQTQMIKPE